MNKNKYIRISQNRYNPPFDYGLNDTQVHSRIETKLVNKTDNKGKKTYFHIIIKNFITFFNIVYFLIALLLVSASAEISDFMFVLIVLANTLIGTFQEIRSKHTIDQLSILSTPRVMVVRNGKKQEIAVEEIVLDDILYLIPGKQIASDAIVVEGEIEVNESQLTGESVPIKKQIGDSIYSGTFVVSGNCHAKVERVGAENAISQLTSQAKTYRKPQSEILGSLNLWLKIVAVFLVVSGTIMFINSFGIENLKEFVFKNGFSFFNEETGLYNTELLASYQTAIKSTSTALIGMIPAGLYLLTSVALAVGVINLAKDKTLVQDIYCIEMLARTDVLCLDKTGTITDGTMTVVRYIEMQRGGNYNIATIVGSMNDALKESNSTSKALETYFGFSNKLKPIEVISFSSDRKYSAVTFENEGTYLIGAPEFVLKRSFDKYADEVNKYANQGLRVLALAHTNAPLKDGKTTRAPKLISLILIEDQIRPDAYDTIKYFRENGVEVKVISGDNPVTVAEVAKRVGIANAEDYISLDGLNNEEVYQVARSYTVFGRVKPEQKQIIIKSLKDAQKTVAMTGDGVNDILALKEADCSIAMASGSDAVRSVSQLVLLDSNFSSLPKVVREGRRVINNISSTSTLFFVKSLFIIILALLTITGMIGKLSPSGLNVFPIAKPFQLFMIEVFIDGLAATFLAIQPNYKKVHGKFLRNVFKKALPGALAIVLEVLVVYIIARPIGLTQEQVVTIVVICSTATCLMVLYMACRPYTIKKAVMFVTIVALCSAFVILSMSDVTIFNFSVKDASQFVILFETIVNPETGEKVFINFTPLLIALILAMTSYVTTTVISSLINFLENNATIKKSIDTIRKRRELNREE